MYQKGEEKKIYEEERVLSETITHSNVFTFKRHLMHLGILSTENVLFSGKLKEYESDKDLWTII